MHCIWLLILSVDRNPFYGQDRIAEAELYIRWAQLAHFHIILMNRYWVPLASATILIVGLQQCFSTRVRDVAHQL